MAGLPIFLQRADKTVTRVAYGLRKILREIAEGVGRGVDYESRVYGVGANEDNETTDPDRLNTISLNGYVFAGKRYRENVARLWISAKGIGDKDAHEAYSSPQVLYPAYRQEGEAEHLEFVQWNLDEALTSKGMTQVINDIVDTYLTYGRAVIEIDWARADTTHPKYKNKVYIRNFWNRDPERFVINPKGLKPGIYLKPYSSSYTVTPEQLLPARKFVVFTNHAKFESPYGLAEVKLLDETLKRLSLVDDTYDKALKKAGLGYLLLKYGNDLKGMRGEEDRKKFLAAATRMSSDTVFMTYYKNEVENISVTIPNEAFSDNLDRKIALISLVLTGNPTTLKEQKNGSYSQEESKGARSKSDLEQVDAGVVCDGFNYQVIPWLLDLNYADVVSYPSMRLIEPDLIQPTVPQAQQDLIPDDTDGDEAQPEGQDSNKEKTPQNANQASKTKDIEAQEKKADKNTGEFQQAQTLMEFEDPEQGAGKDGDGVVSPGPGTGFPDNNPAPAIFGNEEVIAGAQAYLEKMPVFEKAEFDKLPDDEKKKSFTTAYLPGESRVDLVTNLKQAILETVHITNEQEAWTAYLKKAKSILRGRAFLVSELIPSFRYARFSAYNAGLQDYTNKHADDLHGLQYQSMDDARVRPLHRKMHGIVRKIGDPFWRKVNPPIGFNCRCWLEPVTKAQAKADPEKYRFTPKKSLPKVIPDFSYDY